MTRAKVDTVVAAVAATLGPQAVVADDAEIAPWLVDWRGRWQGRSAAMLSPRSTADVAAMVTIAARHGVPIVPQGGNTSMVGGATPPGDGSALILSLRHLKTIRSIDAGSNIAVAEAGVILSQLHDAAASHDRRFPMSLGAKGSATIGGLVSTNAGGTQVLRFGTMRALVAGLEAVMPDGRVHHGLDVLKKDNRGYSLTQLLIGAEGTLGIVTAAALQLVATPPDHATAWVGVDDPQTALHLLGMLEDRSGAAIESFELIPADSLALVLRHIPATRAPLPAPHPWHVLVDFAGTDAAGTLAAMLGNALTDGLARDAVIAASQSQAASFWRLRETISEAGRAAGPAMQHDIAVPVAAMPRFIIEAAARVEAAFPGVTAGGYGHLGDGNIHFHVRAPTGSDAVAWRADIGERASRLVHDLVTAAGGSIAAEHGIGQMKRAELARLVDPVRLDTMRAIKAAIDPQGLMNPGKLL